MNSEIDGDCISGWDDEKVYFWDAASGKQHCVSDEPELVETIIRICRDYYRKHGESAYV